MLVLGGNPWADAIREYTTENGITMIAAGNRPESKLFQIADESYVVDSTSSEEMKKLIREKNIDGVYMGGSEPVIDKACQYINELGLPCYCTHKQWTLLQSKQNFKELCIKHGLPVVPKYLYEDIETNTSLFPVIVKPTDGCGSNGFSICHNLRELNLGVEIARENSPSHTELIEKCVPNDAIAVFYTFSNGVGTFSGSEDKYPVQYPNGSFVGGLYIFNSYEETLFRDKFEQRILSMFKDVEIKEGCIWIEIFRDHGKYYFNEIGYRVGGTGSVFPVAYMSGINQVATDIYYALTGKSIILKKPELFRDVSKDKKYCVYTVHVKSGIIGSFEGREKLFEICPNIVKILYTKKENDYVPDSGSFSQVAALVHILFEDYDQLISTINCIHNNLIVSGINGENMVQRMLSDEQIIQFKGKIWSPV